MDRKKLAGLIQGGALCLVGTAAHATEAELNACYVNAHNDAIACQRDGGDIFDCAAIEDSGRSRCVEEENQRNASNPPELHCSIWSWSCWYS
jgi:hypothetical protein